MAKSDWGNTGVHAGRPEGRYEWAVAIQLSRDREGAVPGHNLRRVGWDRSLTVAAQLDRCPKGIARLFANIHAGG